MLALCNVQEERAPTNKLPLLPLLDINKAPSAVREAPTPLVAAINKKNINVARILLENGANIPSTPTNADVHDQAERIRIAMELLDNLKKNHAVALYDFEGDHFGDL